MRKYKTGILPHQANNPNQKKRKRKKWKKCLQTLWKLILKKKPMVTTQKSNSPKIRKKRVESR